MIRALQKKFVITSMTAISVLLLVLLGGINITNIVLSEKETSRTLGWITAQELGEFPDKPFSGNKSTAPDADKPPEPPSPFGQERNAKDAILSSNYFVVRTDLTGEVLSTDVTRVSTLSEEDAAALASAIWQAADTDGTSGRYKYSVRADEEKEEVVLIFLDTSQDLLPACPSALRRARRTLLDPHAAARDPALEARHPPVCRKHAEAEAVRHKRRS